jgi:exopolysaccharide biosynthesis polyprenyl glycosylphosphotransferase
VADQTYVSEQAVVVPAGRIDTGARPGTARRYGRLALWIALTDALSLDVAILLAHWMRTGFGELSAEFLLVLVISPVIWVGVFTFLQLYSFTRLSPAEEFRRLVEGSGIAVAVKVVLGLVTNFAILSSLARGWLALTWGVALVLTLATRQLWHRHMGRLRADGRLTYRTLIVGTNDEALQIADMLRHPALGFEALGFLQTNGHAPQATGLPILGGSCDLAEVIVHHQVECVFVASSAVRTDLMKQLTRDIRRYDVEVRVSANMTEILSSRLTVQPVGDLLALSLRPARLTGPQAVAKRTFDLAVGSLFVLFTSPIWIVAGLLVKLSSRGPILFRQLRVGKDGRTFRMYKFRTMIRDAEARLPDLLARNEASGPLFKIRDDPRITRVGRFLRRYSIDELPQVLNVLKGDMSLVGPRPPLPNEVATYEEWHRGRLDVRPGITGLWQVRGRSELSFDDYVRLDLFYIENWSILYDLFIMGKTIPAVLLRKGAF